MGYRITYEQYMKKTHIPTQKRNGNLRKWIYCAIVCILLMSALSSSKVRYFLLPGDPQITEKALIALADDLREGEPVTDAVTAFCKEILDNA